MLITVFTPAYNRAYIIGKLYESLCRQGFRDFEWLIVDDGSTDNTAELLAKFSAEGKIDLHYIRQENGGKHRAINRGVKEARGELFYIVDSDDFLPDDALERVAFHYGKVRDDPTFGGVSGLKQYPDGSRVGGEENWDILDCTLPELRTKFHTKGDLAEAYRTAVFKEFPFPDFPGEKFCPEMLIWYRIAKKYKLRFFYEKIYTCEYLPDGLTANTVKMRRSSPTYAMLTYTERLHNVVVPLKKRLRAAINFWRFAFASKMGFGKKLKMGGAISLVGIVPGFLMFLNDGRALKK